MDAEQKAKMDAAAAQAESEFYDTLDEDTRKAVIGWASRHWQKAGYKRIGLIVSQRESFNSEV